MKKTILVLSDSSHVNEIFRAIFIDEYNVQTANTPEEVYEIIDKTVPNLILTTLRHRKGSCFDFLAELKKNDAHQSIPIVIMTTGITPEIMAKASDHKIQDLFKIPVEPIEFCDKIYKILLEYAPSYEKPDPLTGFHKKHYAEERLSELLEKGKKGAFFLIGVDKYNFASARVDDEMIKACSDVLQSFDDSHSFTSVSSDGFMVFVPNITMRNDIEEYAGKLLQQMLEICDHKVFISIGLAVSDRHGSNYDDLYQAADLGLGLARANGKNQCRFYKW